jgi:hypothetical protein
VKHLAEHNVVATFADMEAAGDAVQELGQAGIEAENISLLGQAVDQARQDPDTRLRDMEATGDIAKRTGGGVAAGGALGALAGAAAFAIPGVGPVVGMGMLAAAAAGAIGGGAVGGMVGGVSGLSLEDDWDLTFQEHLRAGRALLAVHATDKADVEKAAKVLEDHGAEQLEWIDAEGRKLEEGQASGDPAGG